MDVELSRVIIEAIWVKVIHLSLSLKKLSLHLPNSQEDFLVNIVVEIIANQFMTQMNVCKKEEVRAGVHYLQYQIGQSSQRRNSYRAVQT